jgi:hypothetical protein
LGAGLLGAHDLVPDVRQQREERLVSERVEVDLGGPFPGSA